MSGVKGKSGRRIWSIEEKKHHTIDKAWLLTDEKLQSKDKDRFGIAKDIVIKDMVNKEKVDMTATITQEEWDILAKYTDGNRITRVLSNADKVT